MRERNGRASAIRKSGMAASDQRHAWGKQSQRTHDSHDETKQHAPSSAPSGKQRDAQQTPPRSSYREVGERSAKQRERITA